MCFALFSSMPKNIVLSSIESERLIKLFGIKVPDAMLVKDSVDALLFAEKIGYPLVLKVISKDIVHKTDAKVVAIDVRDSRELFMNYDLIIKHAKKITSDIDGVLVQRFVYGDVSLIVGGKRDPSFGPVVLVGAGGIFTELIDDSSIRACPVSNADAVSMVDGLKISKVFDGFRNINLDKRSVLKVISGVSHLMMTHKEIQEIDINPLIINHDGAFAVDVRVIV